MNFSISAEKPRPSLVMLLLRLFPPWLKQLLLVLALAGLYLITARLGLALAQPPAEKATVVWLPSGIALAAVLLVGYRIWPGIWLGAFLANLWDFFEPANQFSLAAHLMASGGIALGSTLQTLLGAYLLRRWNGWQTILERSQSVFRFIGVGLLMSLVASSCGVTILYLAGFITLADYPLNWWTWWLGDTVGVLMVTPLLLAWRKPPRVVREPHRLVEAGLLLAALLSVGLGAFGGWSPRGIDAGFLVYMTIPLLVWAALRFGLRGATAALLLTLGIGVWGAAQSHGPFVGETLNESLLQLQIFMSILSVTALTPVGALQGTTSQKIAEQQVATVLAQLEAVLENVDAGLLLIGEDNATIRWANQSFCDFFDIPDMEPIKDDSKLTQALHQYIEANAVVDGPADELSALMHQDPNYCGRLVN